MGFAWFFDPDTHLKLKYLHTDRGESVNSFQDCSPHRQIARPQVSNGFKHLSIGTVGTATLNPEPPKPKTLNPTVIISLLRRQLKSKRSAT